MSFSSDVKEELSKVIPHEAHCNIAELSALVSYCGEVEYNPEKKIILSGDNVFALRKCFTLLNKTFNISTNVFREVDNLSKIYVEIDKNNCDIEMVFKTLSLSDPTSILKKECCKRAYLRGAFLGSGFIGDPTGNYHFEILSNDMDHARFLAYLIGKFNIKSRETKRRGYYVTYIKEAEAISDVLNVLGASKAMMDLINARILKDVRNSINRRNNCDMANITKAVNAASKQIEEIIFIKDKVGLNALPANLREIANIRLEHPESSLTELGEFLDPPVGKSGVNHRLRKISEYAAGLR